MSTKQSDTGAVLDVNERTHARLTVFEARVLPDWVKWSRGQHVIAAEVILTFDQIVYYERVRQTKTKLGWGERTVRGFTENHGTSTIRIPAGSVVRYLKNAEKGSSAKTMCIVGDVYTDTGQRVQLAFDVTTKGISARITRYTSA